MGTISGVFGLSLPKEARYCLMYGMRTVHLNHSRYSTEGMVQMMSLQHEPRPRQVVKSHLTQHSCTLIPHAPDSYPAQPSCKALLRQSVRHHWAPLMHAHKVFVGHSSVFSKNQKKARALSRPQQQTPAHSSITSTIAAGMYHVDSLILCLWHSSVLNHLFPHSASS